MTNSSAMLNAAGDSKEDLLQTVLKSDSLPSLPTVASKLVSLTSREETTLSDVADLISQDIAMSSKILKVANSAFYSFPQQISSIQQAVSMLGTNAVQSLVLSFSFLSMNKISNDSQFDFDDFLKRSLTSASVSKLMMGKLSDVDTEEVFVAGLLQNLGELILACTLPEEYNKVFDAIADEGTEQRAAERDVFGTDHCYIGYEVAKQWNFPTTIVLPIFHHHDPASYSNSDEKIQKYVEVIYLSNVFLNIHDAENPAQFHGQFIEEAKKLLGLDADAIEDILQEAHTKVDEAAANFGLEMEETRPVQEVLQEANIRLSLLNLDYEQINKELIKTKMELETLTAELQEKNELLTQLADMDGLTQVYNNRYFQEALDKEMSRTRRREYNMSLVLMDIDHFKRFNDDYGHLAGDFVLAEFARVLSQTLREYDTLARYGGEEFVVILPETKIEDAMTVAEKLRTAVENAKFKNGKENYNVTASFGVSVLTPEDETSPDKKELIRRADEALYDAKKAGRNQVAAYGEKGGVSKWFKRK
ncbi:MAG: HDOD domain-containing protein [Halioglobus sp.]|nr:HDOD domain-containing protein [Halioglobus sp.]